MFRHLAKPLQMFASRGNRVQREAKLIKRFIADDTKIGGAASQMSESTAKSLFAKADCVCFDVDSTLVTEEGVDVLAKACGKYEEVEALTTAAMSGSMLFQDALKQRLGIMQPTRQLLNDTIQSNPLDLTPGMSELIAELHSQRKAVILISGGFSQLVEHVGSAVNVERYNQFAIELFFFPAGQYQGFNRFAPTARTGGKASVIEMLKKDRGYETIAMVGDGVTDMEVRPHADVLVGFGGNVQREKVKAACDWWVTDAFDLLKTVKPPTPKL